MNYNTTKVKAAPYKYLLKGKLRGITVPTVTTPNMGIVRVKTLVGPRYKVWYNAETLKRYILLPKGTTIEEARLRRDRLYDRLLKEYGAKRRKPRTSEVKRKPYSVTLTPRTYIYARPPYVVKILGKQVAEGWTELEAARKRDAWIEANREKVPHLKMEVGV